MLKCLVFLILLLITRIIAGVSYESRSVDVLRSLDWENLETRWYSAKATFLYKVLNYSAAPSLKDFFIDRNISPKGIFHRII